MPVRRGAVRAGRRAARRRRRTRCSRGSESLRERGGLRRVAAILFHRRAGFSANGMGVWKVPEDEILDDRPADGRVPRRSRTATSARPTPTGRTRSSRWPTAARRRSATRSSTRSPTRRASSERATLYSSTEFKKVRMLYFTGDFRRWEEEHGPERRSLSDVRSAELYRARAARAARRRELARARDARRSAATRSSSSAPRARRSPTSTATSTSTTSAPGAR